MGSTFQGAGRREDRNANQEDREERVGAAAGTVEVIFRVALFSF